MIVILFHHKLYINFTKNLNNLNFKINEKKGGGMKGKAASISCVLSKGFQIKTKAVNTSYEVIGKPLLPTSLLVECLNFHGINLTKEQSQQGIS